MSRNNSLLAALVGVISSGTRRNVTYIRQQALVSQLYPYLTPPETLEAVNSIYGLDVIFIDPPKEYEYNELININNEIYEITVKGIVTNYNLNESLSLNNNIYDINLKEVVVSTGNNELIGLTNGIHDISAKPVGLFISESESLSLTNGIYQITVG